MGHLALRRGDPVLAAQQFEQSAAKPRADPGLALKARLGLGLDGSASYLPEVNNSTTVQVKVMDRPDGQGTILSKATVPIEIVATPSKLRGICANYKVPEDPAEVYAPNPSDPDHKVPKADFVWRTDPSLQTTISTHSALRAERRLHCIERRYSKCAHCVLQRWHSWRWAVRARLPARCQSKQRAVR